VASAHEACLQKASERFRDAYAGVSRAVLRTFPKARPVVEFGMPAWLITRPKGAPRPEREGTMPSDRVFVGLVERKGGVTVHLWYPGDYDLLDRNGAALREAGFKVMRGCLVFNRKQEFPASSIEELLKKVKKLDAAGPTRARPRTGAASKRRTGQQRGARSGRGRSSSP
jgi:uncharacterized protein YdhG (YjbR/CyaY superfamily)